jgi:CRP/FNR family transcriptional regulator, nitrogen oxide reductase regulator
MKSCLSACAAPSTTQDIRKMKRQSRAAPCMTATEIAACLTTLQPRFLDGLTASEITSIVAAATPQKFPANTLIHDQGSPAECFFLLLTGRGRNFFTTPDGQKVVLFWLPPGEVCGGATFLQRPLDYLFSAEAVEDTCALVWERTTIRSFAERYPRLSDNALFLAYDYFHLYRATHIALISHTARERLARVVVNLASGMGKSVPEGMELNVRNEELANEANVTLFTASRLLNEWQRKGLVEKTRGKVLVRSPELLSREV